MKFYRHADTIFVSTSLEQGLMLPPNPLIELLIKNSLAEAQALYDLEVNHFYIAATHVHFIAYVDNPNHVKDFMKQFKTESAHALNKLLGRDKRTLWCEGYDSPVLLTPEDVQNKIRYLYANPSNDLLADRIEDYLGMSSWKAFTNNGRTGHSKRKNCFDSCYLARTDYPYIAHKRESLTRSAYKRLVARMTLGKEKITFEINPNGWRKSFPELTDAGVERINQQAIKELRETEAENRLQRKKEGKTVVSSKAQKQTPIGTPYQPSRTGKKMRCHCHDKDIRIAFIQYTTYLIKEARRIFKNWIAGDFSEMYPPGLFPPSFPKRQEALRAVLAEKS